MKNRFMALVLIYSLFPIQLMSAEVKTRYFAQNKKILDIEIGAATANVKVAIGNMTTNTEKFSSMTYDVWEYSDANGKPQGSLTIDPKTKKIASKSVWVYPGYPEYNLSRLLEEYFKQNKFEKYIPCHSRGVEEVLVDKEKGIFIAARDGNTMLVSWSDPALVKLRIEQFYQKCAKLQPPRNAGN